MLTTEKTHLEECTLANGTRLVYNHMPDSPRLAFYFYLPGGNTLDELSGAPGLSDLVDRLLMKGTAKRSQEDIANAIDSLTLEMDTDTKRDYSVIVATLLEEDLDASMELLSDIFYNATLSEFEREKEKIVGELHMELDSPRARASDLLIRNLFENTSYGTTSSVFLENVEKLNSVETAKKHYHQIYQPNRMMVSFSGPTARDRIAKAIEQHFSRETTASAPLEALDANKLRAHHIQSERTVTFPRDDSNQAHIYKGWLAPRTDDPDFYPIVVLNTLLGAAGLTSRLFLELRDKQGLAYNVRSSYDAYKHQGLFLLYIGTEPKNKDKCLEGFKTECQKLVDAPVSQKELDETIENIMGRRTVFLETAVQQASYIGANIVLGRTLEDMERMPERLKAVTAKQIQQAAQRLFATPAITSIVGPSSIL